MIKIIKHSLIDEISLTEIITLKNYSWKYSYKEHYSWIDKNILDDDLHFLMYDKNELIGYLNIVKVMVNTTNNTIPFLGVGNVCTKYKGRGDGLKLMKYANNFIAKNELQGLLFCKHHLTKFYEKTGWEKINNLYPNNDACTMVYNNRYNTSIFSYQDRLF